MEKRSHVAICEGNYLKAIIRLILLCNDLGFRRLGGLVEGNRLSISYQWVASLKFASLLEKYGSPFTMVSQLMANSHAAWHGQQGQISINQYQHQHESRLRIMTISGYALL